MKSFDINLQYRKVREVVNIGAKICLSSARFLPLVGQRLPCSTHYLHRRQKIGDLKASRKNYYIKFFSDSALTNNSRLINFLNPFGDEAEILGVKCFKVIGIEDPSFATKRKLRHNEFVIFLWCHPVDVLLGILFSCMPFLLCLLPRHIRGHKIIVGLE